MGHTKCLHPQVVVISSTTHSSTKICNLWVSRVLCEFRFYNKWQFKVKMPSNLLIKGPLGQTSVEPGRAKQVQSLATRIEGFMVVSAIAKGPPNYKYAKEARSPLATPGSAAGTREDPFVDCYLAASRSPLLGLSLALNWAAMRRNTYARRCFMPHHDFLGPSKLSNMSSLPLLRGTSRPKS